MKTVLSSALLLCTLTTALGQHVTFPDDNTQRGYYDRPYMRYEAEPGKCSGNASFLEPSDDQRDLQSEASNQIAATLSAKGDYAEWTCDRAAAGMTIRFSLPDSDDGKGTKGLLELYVDGKYVCDIELDSYWAWQYTVTTGAERYPDNTPSADKFARMRFDEKAVLLDEAIPEGSTFRLAKKDDNTDPYTIDFVELEPVAPALTFDDIADENKVMYDGTGSTLQSFINSNSGKTVFIPAGDYTVGSRITISVSDVKVIGAGMWHTRLYFSASPDAAAAYPRRGFECSQSNVTLEGMTIDTSNNKRYFNNESSKQMGKGLQGSWGTNSVFKDLWVTHFECGAWIADYSGNPTDNLLVSGCRFRSNYADGINLCSGTKNSVVEHCSFRNNGDDDMASWSTGNWTENNTFRYNTAENNWRASSIGFFGGRNNSAVNCVVIDGLEAGIRAVGDFPGTGFASDGHITFDNISIYHSGCKSGTVGIDGDFWGNQNGAVYLLGSGSYDLVNVHLSNIDIIDSRWNGVQIGCSNSRSIKGLRLDNINIDGTGNYGIYYSNPKGDGEYSNISFSNIGNTNVNDCPEAFEFTGDGSAGVTEISTNNATAITTDSGVTALSGVKPGCSISLYDISGRLVTTVTADNQGRAYLGFLRKGIYIARNSDTNQALKFSVR